MWGERAACPGDGTFAGIPEPVVFLPGVVSAGGVVVLAVVEGVKWSVPVLSSGTVAVPLGKSFPEPRDLGVTVPEPEVAFPVDVAVACFRFVFLVRSLVSFSSMGLVLFVVPSDGVLCGVLSMGYFPVFCDGSAGWYGRSDSTSYKGSFSGALRRRGLLTLLQRYICGRGGMCEYVCALLCVVGAKRGCL